MSGVFGDGGLVANALTYISGGFVIQEGLERIFEELTIEEITLAQFKETKNIAIVTQALDNLLGQVYSQVLNEIADLEKKDSPIFPSGMRLSKIYLTPMEKMTTSSWKQQ